MNKLTDRQKEILDYIYKFIQVNKYPPSIRGIGENFRITPKGVYDHLKAIEKKGYIERVDNANRSIKLSEKYFEWSGYEKRQCANNNKHKKRICYDRGKIMASAHAALQKATKEYLESIGWEVVENKKGKQSSRYNSGRKGIADLLAVKNNDYVCWLEIKTKNDVQKPDQKEFQKEKEKKGHLYFLIYNIDQVKAIFNDKT